VKRCLMPGYLSLEHTPRSPLKLFSEPVVGPRQLDGQFPKIDNRIEYPPQRPPLVSPYGALGARYCTQLNDEPF